MKSVSAVRFVRGWEVGFGECVLECRLASEETGLARVELVRRWEVNLGEFTPVAITGELVVPLTRLESHFGDAAQVLLLRGVLPGGESSPHPARSEEQRRAATPASANT